MAHKPGAGFTGKTHSEETRKKMSATHRGKTFSTEHRAKLSAAKMGNQCAKGSAHSPEHRARSA